MDLSQVLQRIADNVTGIKQVGAAASVEQMLEAIRDFPACFMFAPVEAAGENSTLGKVSQRVEQTFSLAVFVKASGDISTAAIDAISDASRIRSEIIAALLGWCPCENDWVIEYDGSSMPYAKDGEQVWLYKFKTAYLIRS